MDAELYEAVGRMDTPRLDRIMARISGAANYSKLWVAAAGLLSVLGGRRGRRAAADGLVSIAVTATLVNVAIKPLSGRRRPDARTAQIRMPISRSFPSGHSASAFAFATGVAATLPAAGAPLRTLAALVAYSRVHTGVHYPADVAVGSLVGSSVARLLHR